MRSMSAVQVCSRGTPAPKGLNKKLVAMQDLFVQHLRRCEPIARPLTPCMLRMYGAKAVFSLREIGALATVCMLLKKETNDA